MTTARTVCVWVLVLGCGLLNGCTTELVPVTCTPNESKGCIGPQGCEGRQVCSPDGKEFSLCECFDDGADSPGPNMDSDMDSGAATSSDSGAQLDASVDGETLVSAPDGSSPPAGDGGADAQADALMDGGTLDPGPDGSSPSSGDSGSGTSPSLDAGDDSVMCGSQTCSSDTALSGCCFDEGQEECGADLTDLPVPLVGCAQHAAPGEASEYCGTQLDLLDIDRNLVAGKLDLDLTGVDLVLPGCCRPEGTCGVVMDELYGAVLGLGCQPLDVLAAEFEGASVPSIPCGDAIPGCGPEDEYCTEHACWDVPPTGSTTCYDWSEAISCSSLPCNSDGSPAFCGQGAQYVEGDHEYVQSTVEGDPIITDSLTGLVWQDGVAANPPGVEWDEAIDYCSDLDYAGATDWRLPTAHELLATIAHVATATGFPAADNVLVWSATTAAGNPDEAWVLSGSELRDRAKSTPRSARCVRGLGVMRNASPCRFRTLEDNVSVIDRATNLQWQKESGGAMNWQEALEYCEGLTLGGESDWRLPTLTQALSLLDFEQFSPASSFPDEPSGREEGSSYYWTSTNDDRETNAFFVLYSYPLFHGTAKNYDHQVRCVRAL